VTDPHRAPAKPWDREVVAVGCLLVAAGTLTGAAMFALLRAAALTTEIEERELFGGEPLSGLHRWGHHLATLVLAVAAGCAWGAFAVLRRRRGTPNEALTPWGGMAVIGAVGPGFVLARGVAALLPHAAPFG